MSGSLIWAGYGSTAPPLQQSRKARSGGWIGFRCFVCAAAVSELLVLRHLWNRWPLFVHPMEPPTAKPPNSSPSHHHLQQGTEAPQFDATFNGIPMVHVQDASQLHSSIHCVGENFEPNAWMFRSCRFRNLCLDLNNREFVLIRSSQERKVHETRQGHEKFVTLSSIITKDIAVALGIIHPSRKPTEIGGGRFEHDQAYADLKWFPKVIEQGDPSLSAGGYYELSSDFVMVPFTSTFHTTEMTGPMQPVWDVAFPIFTLLSMFGLTNRERKPLLIRHDDAVGQHQDQFDDFLPLMGLPQKSMTFTRDVKVKGISKPQSHLVCAREAAAGIGMISDRGFHLPSKTQRVNDGMASSNQTVRHVFTNNVAQGVVLSEFRNFILQNLGIPSTPLGMIQPAKVVFYGAAAQQMAKVEQSLSDQSTQFPNVLLESFDALESDNNVLLEMAEAVSTSSALVAVCCRADAALAAALLPLGSSLIILYDDEKYGYKLSKTSQAYPTLQRDWDLIRNAGSFSVNWLPYRRADESFAARLTALLKQELMLRARP